MFPPVQSYEKAISKGSSSFKTLDLKFSLFRTKLPKLYMYGCGQFAAVFKANSDKKSYALRCFLQASSGGLKRYNSLSKYLKRKKLDWLCGFDFLENEIIIENKTFPVLLMDWVEGDDLQKFITNNINNKQVLTDLQKEFVSLSKKIEKNNIGHGDIQDANVIICNTEKGNKIKLIDYDGMFIPDLEGENSVELGKPAYQHPKRTHQDFNNKMDRYFIFNLFGI